VLVSVGENREERVRGGRRRPLDRGDDRDSCRRVSGVGQKSSCQVKEDCCAHWTFQVQEPSPHPFYPLKTHLILVPGGRLGEKMSLFLAVGP
jgi:hypothetical protein